MQQLWGGQAGTIEGSFMKELFLQRLPATVRMVLASTGENVALEDLAQLADKIVEVALPSVSAVHATPVTAEVEQLRAEVARLTKLVQSMASPRRRSASPHPPADSALCWYHQRYGDDAQKCKPPCSRSGNALAGR